MLENTEGHRNQSIKNILIELKNNRSETMTFNYLLKKSVNNKIRSPCQ